jgi:hypothetical protein
MSVTHQWKVKVAKNSGGDGFSVTFSDSVTGKSLNLDELSVSSGDCIYFTASGDPFDAHWHARSTAIVADQAPAGSKPNFDCEDDNSNWNWLAKDNTPAVMFTVTGPSKTRARLQLKVPGCADPFGTKSGSVCVLKVPDPSTIIRLTVNVS